MTHLLLAAAEKSALKGFLGALHPGIVHFPIALLAVGALFETLQLLRKKKEPAPGTPALAYLAAAAAVPATFFGFMFADDLGSEGRLIDLHQWLGVSSTVAAVAGALFAVKAKTSSMSLLGLRIALILGSGLVLATGYVAGDLTRGENHLLKFFLDKKQSGQTTPVDTDPLTKLAEPGGSKVDFVKDIAPIIKDMCFRCHGGEKVKGKFKMNTKALAMEGGDSGKEILPFKPELSKFYKSLTLPMDDDDLMPPKKEKLRPTKEQIERVRKWIEQGAEWPDGYEFKK